MFSFPSRQNEPADVRAVRLLGPGEVQMEKLQELIKVCLLLWMHCVSNVRSRNTDWGDACPGFVQLARC